MFFRLFLDPRFLLALMIAPFIAGSAELTVTNMMADRFFSHYPWTLSSSIWRASGRGEPLVPIWLLDGLAFTYIATYVCGLPLVAVLFFRRRMNLLSFLIAGATTAFCFKILMIMAFLARPLISSSEVRALIFNLGNFPGLVEWLWPMTFSTTLYGFLVGLIFWVVAVWKNPDLPARDGSSSHLTSRTQ